MIAATQSSASGLIVVLCCAGISACFWWCVREGQRCRDDVARWWESEWRRNARR